MRSVGFADQQSMCCITLLCTSDTGRSVPTSPLEPQATLSRAGRVRTTYPPVCACVLSPVSYRVRRRRHYHLQTRRRPTRRRPPSRFSTHAHRERRTQILATDLATCPGSPPHTHTSSWPVCPRGRADPSPSWRCPIVRARALLSSKSKGKEPNAFKLSLSLSICLFMNLGTGDACED